MVPVLEHAAQLALDHVGVGLQPLGPREPVGVEERPVADERSRADKTLDALDDLKAFLGDEPMIPLLKRGHDGRDDGRTGSE